MSLSSCVWSVVLSEIVRHRGRKANNKQVEYSSGESDKNTVLHDMQIHTGLSQELSVYIQKKKEWIGGNMSFIVYRNHWLCFPILSYGRENLLVCI